MAYEALPGIAIADLGIVPPGLDTGDAQALVMIDLLVPIIQGLVGSPTILAGGRKLKIRDRCGGQVPEPDAFALRRKLGRREQNGGNGDRYAHPVASGIFRYNSMVRSHRAGGPR